MSDFSERIVRAIVSEEMRCRGYVSLRGLSKRLAVYLDEPEHQRLIEDAGTTDIVSAFLFFLPIGISVDPMGIIMMPVPQLLRPA